MTRARVRVVLAAVIACSPALVGASLAGTHNASDQHIANQETTRAVTTAAETKSKDGHGSKDDSDHHKSKPTDLTDHIKVESQQVAAQVVQAHQEAKRRAEQAAQQKAEEKKKAAEAAAHKKAEEKKADEARTLAASRAKDRKCDAPSQVADLSPSQTANAEAIVRAGRKMHIDEKGQVIALSTALQESGLQNYANVNVPASMGLKHQAVGYDHDSVGLFQQRPVAPWGEGNWGTPQELMTPEKSATKFYQALEGIQGWHNLPVTMAAQQVQVSAFPSAYADDEVHAWSIVHALPCA
ncbi:MAG: hypothetical protein WCA46_16290 [Actinocatenispora sp.]